MIKHMKRCIFTKVNFMALFLFAVLMVACTTDVYEPKPIRIPIQCQSPKFLRMVLSLLVNQKH